jgi:hypothetical protein|tara:strand:- start:168 stop:1757 length:1590 start_codon:yes stop_codon:yes gene_type:complete
MVMLAWLHQGVYGKMTEIARSYQISRTFLYQLLLMANLQLETLFSEEKRRAPADPLPFEPLILLLRLEGKCSLGSIASILQALEYHPHSVGYLSQFFQQYGHSLPSTLSTGSPKVVFYLSDELFALQAPILITIDAHSTAILRIELAGDRSAETWRAHFAALEDHYFFPLGMASDRGQGLVAGYQAAVETGVWVSDHFHEFRALYQLLHQWERKAYAAMGKEYEAAQKFAQARSESHLEKRLRHYEEAHQACQRAIARYDHLALLLHLLQETLYLCSPEGRLRTADGVRTELTLLFTWMEAMKNPALTRTLKPLRQHMDDILVPFEQLEAIQAELGAVVPSPALDFLVLAWHHDHLVYQTRSTQQRYHQREREERLAVAEGLLDDDFEPLKALVFDRLNSVVRASSLVEMINSLVRPYLHSCKGQITQETLNLIMFYHNHHRYQSGKRKGKAPLELLTGQPLPGEWWERLIQQVQEAEKESDPIDRPLEPPLHLWIPPEEATEPPTRWDRSTNGAPGRPSEHDLDTQAA